MRDYAGRSCYGRTEVSSGGSVYSTNPLFDTYTTVGVRPAMHLTELKNDTTLDIKYNAAFESDGKVVSNQSYYEGETIALPKDPQKEGYTFKCWNPEVPETMPAEDITFKAVFEKNSDNPVDPDNPTANARLNLKLLNVSLYKNTEVTIMASATGVPEGYVLAVYDGGNSPAATGTNQSVTYKIPGLVNSDKTITVKVIDKDGNVQKDGNGDNLIGTLNIKLKTGFVNNIIAFFKKLFKSNNATILV